MDSASRSEKLSADIKPLRHIAIISDEQICQQIKRRVQAKDVKDGPLWFLWSSWSGEWCRLLWDNTDKVNFALLWQLEGKVQSFTHVSVKLFFYFIFHPPLSAVVFITPLIAALSACANPNDSRLCLACCKCAHRKTHPWECCNCLCNTFFLYIYIYIYIFLFGQVEGGGL